MNTGLLKQYKVVASLQELLKKMRVLEAASEKLNSNHKDKKIITEERKREHI